VRAQDYKTAWNEKREVWEVRWSEQLPDGRWRSRAVSTGEKARDGKASAERFASEFIRAERAAQEGSGDKTVAELFALYEADCRVRGVHRNTITGLRRPREFFGKYFPEAIRVDDVAAYRAKRRVKDSTLRTELIRLKTLFNWAVLHKHLTSDKVPHIPTPGQQQGRDLFLDERQEPEFYALCMGESVGQERLSRVSLFGGIALDTGARLDAIAGLTWDRVRIADGTIDFREPGRRVTKKRRASVPISRRLRPLLERAYRERTSNRLFDLSANRLGKEFGAFADRVGFPWVTPHVLRHTFATLNVRAGADLGDVAQILADDPVTVMRNYQHHRPQHLRAAVDVRWT
jgi:integrase